MDSLEDEVKEQETWIEWLRRRTHVAEDLLASLKIDDWITSQRKRKFSFTGHLLRRTDGRWSTTLVGWSPEGGCRARGRPKKRWIDVLDQFFMACFGVRGGGWTSLAENREDWSRMEEIFMSYQAPGC